MHIVFVHGMRQEYKDPIALKSEWEQALKTAWTKAGLAMQQYTSEMPFYGDVLNELTEAVRGDDSDIIIRGEADPNTFTPLEEALIRDMAAQFGVTDAEVRAELSQEVVARGPANWEWVQAIGRVLESKVPGVGRFGLGFVRQVDAYLSRPHIQKAVDDIVRPSFGRGPTVVVSHSLGTIVSYRLLRAAGASAKVPLFVTLGSPLGIAEVKKFLKPPSLKIPEGVTHWLNGTDERDYVALYSKLGGAEYFVDGIQDISDLHNGQNDAHLITDYLGHPEIFRPIYSAL